MLNSVPEDRANSLLSLNSFTYRAIFLFTQPAYVAPLPLIANILMRKRNGNTLNTLCHP